MRYSGFEAGQLPSDNINDEGALLREFGYPHYSQDTDRASYVSEAPTLNFLAVACEKLGVTAQIGGPFTHVWDIDYTAAMGPSLQGPGSLCLPDYQTWKWHDEVYYEEMVSFWYNNINPTMVAKAPDAKPDFLKKSEAPDDARDDKNAELEKDVKVEAEKVEAEKPGV
jgi:hypothetical protein